MRMKLWLVMITVVTLISITGLVACACISYVIEIEYPTEGKKFSFDAGIPGKITIPCRAKTTPGGGESGIIWSCSGLEDSTATFSNNGTGRNVTLTITGLPNDNSGFGDFSIEANMGGAVGDSCTAKIFFYGLDIAKNHPGEDSGITPNWYYYWSMTGANTDSQSHVYENADGSYTDFDTDPNVNTWVAYICNGANNKGEYGIWDGAEGIDFFANACRHEEQHRLDFATLWGENINRDDDQDPDGDYLPSQYESNNGSNIGLPYHSPGYSKYFPLTPGITDHFKYGRNLRDCEDYCLHRQVSWGNNQQEIINSDWSDSPYPKQYGSQ